ncbi:MAG: methionine--tRNA ligase [Sphingomonadales bacterium]
MTAPAEPFYITTAISYPNGAPHIGHAYEAIATDAIARFYRLAGRDVFFLTGTDEHGLKMLQTARKEGLTARQMADKLAPLFETMVERLNCSNDRFIRTSEPAHYDASQEIWRRLDAAGDIYKDGYAGWYSVRDEAFYDESELTKGEGGQRLSPQGTPVEWTEEETYFFRLSRYADRLLEHYERHPEFIQPDSRRNEIVQFVSSGLKDLSISRNSFDWGVPVPGDDSHVMYVWIDALTNYLTGVGFPDEASANFQRYWPANVHIIGKDITRFHTVYWPAFLMSAGLPLPQTVFGHGFLFNRGEKMSKSVGNVIDPLDMAARYGVDQLRFFLLRDVPFGQDGSYSHEAIVNRCNADLANDLGNLAQRSLSMMAKHCDGNVPTPGALTDEDKAFLEHIDGALSAVAAAMDELAVHKALDAIWSCVGRGNGYFAGQEPWALRKTNPERMATVLYVTAEALRQIAILAQPFIPAGAAALLDLLNVSAQARDFTLLGKPGRLAAGGPLERPVPIFPRLELEEQAAE